MDDRRSTELVSRKITEMYRRGDGKLDLSKSHLTSLQWLPDDVKYLDCSFNENLKKIPKLPIGLVSLNCSFTDIDTLPTLPDGLQELKCSENELRKLPSLPPTLKFLNCQGNYISSLPDLPSSLVCINCSRNNLKVIPELPLGLKHEVHLGPYFSGPYYSTQFNGNPFIEPFKSIHDKYYMKYIRRPEYNRSNDDLEELIKEVNGYYDAIRRGRNLVRFQQVIKNKPFLGNEGVSSVIGSFLSGKVAKTYPMPLEEQQNLLYKNVTGKDRTVTEANWYYGPEKGREQITRVSSPLRISAVNAAAGAGASAGGHRKKTRTRKGKRKPRRFTRRN